MAFPKPNHHLLPLLSTITVFLMLLCKAKSQDNFTDFTFNTFDSSNSDKLIFQGDATISSGTVQLTSTNSSTGNPEKNSVGRVLYAEPIHLWNSNQDPAQFSSFETTFKLLMSSPTREIAGDGITFFIAPVNTTIPDDSDGGFFGLFSNNTLPTSVDVCNSTYQILFVEFDNYVDSRWDPNYKHIGINVNTVRSRATIPWDRESGAVLTTTISYNTNNKILYVSSSYDSSEFPYEVSSAVDLDVLPEYVAVGFSASTGDSAVETHNIVSWTFSAWLHNVSTLATTSGVKHAPLYSE